MREGIFNIGGAAAALHGFLSAPRKPDLILVRTDGKHAIITNISQ
jgi:hypothetical protein